MPNMSYCRFENTLGDLLDCQEALFEPCSEMESRHRKALIETCYLIAQDFTDEDGSLLTEDIDALLAGKPARLVAILYVITPAPSIQIRTVYTFNHGRRE